ncbi:MAG: DNA alkylation repair protein [Actinomycetota bacterium]|nr:DNA alkylation repair protein [Actinomycetota bacterium]
MTLADEVTAQLDRLLTDVADDATRAHWERYMKGTAAFRGVPMAGIRKVVRCLWKEHHLGDRPTDELLALAQRWFARRDSEDKLAAVLLIAEHLVDRLELRHHAALAHPLEVGNIADWGVCDWYANKALHGYLTEADDERESRARAIAAWTHTDRLWQRRAGLVAFVRLAPLADRQFDGFIPLVLDACAANLVSDDRFAHTGPGWVLRELSKAAPEAVAEFVESHPELSAEGRRMATARLRPGKYRRR